MQSSANPMIRVAVDAAGGDFGLRPNLEGALLAVQDLDCAVDLVGPEAPIREGLGQLPGAQSHPRIQVLHTEQAVGMDEDPVGGCRDKAEASIMLSTKLVADKKADAVVSAGNSGAAMVAALWHLKRIPGILRPALAAPFPTLKGTTILLDAGANTECKPWHLVQFAMMGAVYSRHIFHVPNPSIGILSNGEEDSKGNELVAATIPLLRHSGLNFYGPVEGRDVPAGTTDVVVCDGFVGNICIKTTEGIAGAIFQLIRGEVEKSLIRKIGALLMKNGFRNLKRRLSYDEYGGAPLLGVNGISIVCHGKSNAKAIYNAIRVAKDLVEARANEQISKALDRMKSNPSLARASG